MHPAAAHLHAQPFVDKARIFLAGYSWGAAVAALTASPHSASAFQSAHRFRASAGLYGSCGHAFSASAPLLDLLGEDSDRPVLMLMAGRDIEMPPRHCFPRLERMQAAGRPVAWHVYADATHGWDKAEQAGHVYRSTTGESMMYRFDGAVTADSTRRTVEFFEQQGRSP